MHALIIAGAITSVVAALSAIAWVLSKVYFIARNLDNFLADWNGEASRPGVPARKGVVERLSNIEKEVTINGGKSIKDAVLEMKSQHTLIAAKLDEVARLQLLYPPPPPPTPVQINIHKTEPIEIIEGPEISEG